MKKIYFIALLFGFFILKLSIVYALEPISKPTIPTNNKNETEKVLVVPSSNLVKDSSGILDKRYIELLERVNQQNSLLWNPYNTSIAILAFLVAFGAIGFAFMIYRQGKDYRDQRDTEVKAFFKKQEDLNTEARSNLLAQGRELDVQIKTTIDEMQTRINGVEESTKTIEESKLKELKEKIAKLMIQKESVTGQVANLSSAVSVEYESPTSLSFSSLSAPSWHRCSQCKFGFKLLGARVPGMTIMGTSGSAQCPKCGNIDSI